MAPFSQAGSWLLLKAFLLPRLTRPGRLTPVSLQGLSLRVFCLLGAFPDLPMDAMGMSGMITMVGGAL